VLVVCLELDLLPHARAELSPFSTKIVRVTSVGDKYRLRVGVKNTSKVKAVDTQITTVFWRCSGKRKPFTVRKSNANPISQDVPEQVELDFTLNPIEPLFIMMSFAYRSRERGRLRQQHPSFYYRWSGSDSSLVHASREERDVIIERLKKRETIPPAIEFPRDVENQRVTDAAREEKSEAQGLQGFHIEALPPIADLTNITQVSWERRKKVIFTGDAALRVVNVLPAQGIDLVSFRLLSITPPMDAVKVWEGHTQDAILECIDFSADIPATLVAGKASTVK